MIINSLIWRNTKRSIKNYLIYMFTMILISSLMFAFHSLIFSRRIKDLYQKSGELATIVGITTVFITLIVIWLVHYMVKFMMEKRSTEFGIYLLMGMSQKKIRSLFIKENLLLSMLAFIIGMIPGFFFQELFTSIYFKIVGQNYKLSIEWNWETLGVTAGCFFLAFLIAIIRCRKRFKKMKIKDFLNMDKENEEVNMSHPKVLGIVFFLSLGYIIFYFVQLLTNGLIKGLWFPLTLLFLLSIYTLYIGISGFIASYLNHKGKGVYQGATIFLLRQLASKVRTMRFTMGTLTILFTGAMIACSMALIFQDAQNRKIKDDLPFDVIGKGEPGDERYYREEILKDSKIKDYYSYPIYEGPSTKVRDYLIDHIDYPVKTDSISNIFYDTDLYMKLSDYNKLREILGYDEIELKSNEYLLQVKSIILKDFDEYDRDTPYDGLVEPMNFKGIEDINFCQNGMNGAHFIIIIPDQRAEKLKVFCQNFIINLDGNAPLDLGDRLYQVREEKGIDEPFNMAVGNDYMFVSFTTLLIRSYQIREASILFTTLAFCLIYASIIFVCVALTILAVQQLSDSKKYQFRYAVLSKLGSSKKEISKIILKQLFMYYFCPYLMSLIMSSVLGGYLGQIFVIYGGLGGFVYRYIILSILVFTVIYILYFIATYVEFCRNATTTIRD